MISHRSTHSSFVLRRFQRHWHMLLQECIHRSTAVLCSLKSHLPRTSMPPYTTATSREAPSYRPYPCTHWAPTALLGTPLKYRHQRAFVSPSYPSVSPAVRLRDEKCRTQSPASSFGRGLDRFRGITSVSRSVFRLETPSTDVLLSPAAPKAHTPAE